MRSRVLMLAAMVVILSLATALPALAQTADLAAAATWLKSQQQADGGFSDGFSDGSSVGATAEAVLAAAAAGQNPATWGSPSALDYIAAQAPTLTETAPLAKTILALEAAGADPANFGGADLVSKLQDNYDAGTGAFQGLVNDHAFAMLALKAAGAEVPAEAADALEALQADDGGWSFDAQSQSDTNTTAAAIQALLAAARPAGGDAIEAALGFLETQQNDDGGFPYQIPSDFGTATDANSTAYVIQTLRAAGEDLAGWNNPEQALASLQLPEGAFEFQAGQGANYLATAQAIPALAGTTFVNLGAAPAGGTGTTAAPATLPTTGGNGSSAVALVVSGLVLLLGAGAAALARRWA